MEHTEKSDSFGYPIGYINLEYISEDTDQTILGRDRISIRKKYWSSVRIF